MAYALIVSLKQTLEPLLDSARSRIQISSSELQPIYEDLCYLKSFFDKVKSLEDSNSVEELEKDVKDVLQNARDLIESHLSDVVHSAGDGSWNSSAGFSPKMVKVKDKLSPFIDVLKAKENELTGNQQLPPDVVVPVPVLSRINHEIVELEYEVEMLQKRLLEPDSSLQVCYIVGMFGIGKTTLAKKVYNNEDTVYKFHMRLFVEIGVKYKLEELLLRLLRPLLRERISEVKKEETVHELGDRLRESLSHMTYLVVLDDLRDMQVWEQLRPYFPNVVNGSRIMITTRMTNMDCFRKYIHQKRLLTHQASWLLFYQIAFSNMKMDMYQKKGYMDIGWEIAGNMGGLPLALVEIGEVVSKLPKTVECWRKVAQNMNSHIQETSIPKAVNAGLPQLLKACFLYLCLFQRHYDIPTSTLIKLWVAEGFIEPEADQSLEQIAEEYLEDLVSRSLVIVHERSYTGRIKTCGMIHELVWDVCVTEAEQQKLFCIVNEGTSTKNQRRLSIQSDVAVGVTGSGRLRSLVFVCADAEHQDPLPVFERVKWLRVLHALPIRFNKFPDQVLKLVRLRYLAITFDGELPSSISTLWDLQVLIIISKQGTNSPVFLPLEIWELQKLRHLHCMGFDLPLPSADLHLMKLLTLSGVSFRTCVDGVLARIPNVIKLGIRFNPADHTVEVSGFQAVFSYLYHLESFKCGVTNQSEAAFSLLRFPSGLIKLTLGGSGFLWDEHTSIISDLPHLQVLKLRWRAFCGPKWELYEGGFPWLKILVLEDLDIEQLIAESNHFPVLQKLLIRRCYKLQEIPIEMGDIPTLEVIEVKDCCESLIESVRHIKREQEELGNEDLLIRIL
ncbi:putative late blight resistance protein homolog R1A-3 [Salvia splendens]|uniref:putative late blight resistance protein homolog R1A-3 n=1 Tax=Salvia splendens TaxID=180675 RepID=UPI001C253F56|nr:putative late blight resistance protein homolog R1A-3 [Salvia splendens]XP_042038715.1 putative late blight resistance protein homolog R1A-3 [Salvia splendens]XP_042038716.1 putative late blight resistance protein homolog R1A-3 [Salvia splendens]